MGGEERWEEVGGEESGKEGEVKNGRRWGGG